MDCNTRILLADPDGPARAFLAEHLTADGFEVIGASSLEASRRLLAAGGFGLAIVEPDMPDGDGLELITAVRASDRLLSRVDPDLPLVVVSARGGDVDRVRGFERGCDDYVTKPYVYAELRGRVSALLRRRSTPSISARTRVGPLELDVLARQAWLEGSELELSNKEFSLLRVLATDPSRVFTRAELLKSVWGWEEELGSRALDAHVCRLRRKLRDGGAGLIVNVWGVGYRLVDAVATPVLG